jgi:hypothetical protein
MGGGRGRGMSSVGDVGEEEGWKSVGSRGRWRVQPVVRLEWLISYKMPLSGRCVIEDTLVLNYGTTNVASTHTDNPFLSWKRRSRFKTHKWPLNEQEFDPEYRWRAKSIITVLTRVRRNLLLCYTLSRYLLVRLNNALVAMLQLSIQCSPQRTFKWPNTKP